MDTPIGCHPLEQGPEKETGVPSKALEDPSQPKDLDFPPGQKTPLPTPIVGSVIYPFVNELVLGLGITNGDPKRVGYYAGLIESSFFFTEFLVIFQWGRLSDKYGRKPIITIGLFGVSLSILSFGFSRTFATVVISRCLAGLLNGNIGVIKSSIGELSDSTNVQDAFRYMPLCWPLGEAIGGLIGGYLSNPNKHFPRVFKSSPFFESFPYLLPCATAAMFPLTGVILSTVAFRETNVKAIRHGSPPHSCSEHSTSAHPSFISIRTILTRRVVVAGVNYWCLCLLYIVHSVLLPLYLSTPLGHGGLGFDPRRIGIVLCIQGAVSIILIILLAAKMQKHFGVAMSFTIAIAGYFVVFSAFPIMTMMTSAISTPEISGTASHLPWTVWVVLAAQILCVGLINAGFGSIFVLITEAAPKAHLGGINGFAQTGASLVRAIGPAGSTSLFAFSVERHHILGGGLVWLILVILTFVSVGMCFLLEEPHGVPLGGDEEEMIALLENREPE
ncbi:major facilitator superfamily domain-containing protein [Cantharellus anzutake]|uniref:major facilitator superfamily domain-containing protein n=1 Tax=Cantharellus anzutake TaxID=1750568 RepID=UPI0019036BE3|nr:major facilitator superfamily domain-containing protein [Cantharellus anzutake]KAF8329788.1 major facilitator superfamily domain-containing protein [Cantharellus anzutake]